MLDGVLSHGCDVFNRHLVFVPDIDAAFTGLEIVDRCRRGCAFGHGALRMTAADSGHRLEHSVVDFIDSGALPRLIAVWPASPTGFTTASPEHCYPAFAAAY